MKSSVRALSCSVDNNEDRFRIEVAPAGQHMLDVIEIKPVSANMRGLFKAMGDAAKKYWQEVEARDGS